MYPLALKKDLNALRTTSLLSVLFCMLIAVRRHGALRIRCVPSTRGPARAQAALVIKAIDLGRAEKVEAARASYGWVRRCAAQRQSRGHA